MGRTFVSSPPALRALPAHPALRDIKLFVHKPLPTLQGHAIDNLQFIRDAMSRASRFTAVPGWGGVVIGVTALVTAALTARTSGTMEWTYWWMAEAVVAVAIG